MSQVDRIKREKESHKKRIALRDSILKLQKNRDFFKVIEEAFMERECARYARISGLLTRTEEERSDALAKAQAAGHLAEFLEMSINLGNAAENALRSLNEEEAAIIAEGDE